jgi:type IV pilus assembly protein PilF
MSRRLRTILTTTIAMAVAAWMGPVAASQSGKNAEQAAAVNAELAVAYLREGNIAAARDKIEKALEQNPRTAKTQMTAGIVYDRLNDRRRATGHFDQAVKLGKDDPDILNNTAAYFCRYGQYKRGEQYLVQAAQSALNRAPDVAYANAGRCARADNRPQDAEQYFRKALATNPKQVDALLQMAELSLASGNGLQARAFLERYTAVAPATAGTLMLGRRIELNLGDDAQARQYAQRIKTDFPMSVEAGQLFDEEHAKP